MSLHQSRSSGSCFDSWCDTHCGPRLMGGPLAISIKGDTHQVKLQWGKTLGGFNTLSFNSGGAWSPCCTNVALALWIVSQNLLRLVLCALVLYLGNSGFFIETEKHYVFSFLLLNHATLGLASPGPMCNHYNLPPLQHQIQSQNGTTLLFPLHKNSETPVKGRNYSPIQIAVESVFFITIFCERSWQLLVAKEPPETKYNHRP